MDDEWGLYGNWGEYRMADADGSLDRRISQAHERIGALEMFTGANGRNGIIKRIDALDAEHRATAQILELVRRQMEHFATHEEVRIMETRILEKLDAMDEARVVARRWRWDTVMATVASFATLGALLYTMYGG